MKVRRGAYMAHEETHPTKDWTVAIYMVADGPSGSRALDQIAAEELLHIVRAADSDHEPKPLSRIHVAVQVDLSDQSGIIRYALGQRLEIIPEQNSATTSTLKEFLN